ncbi:MAG: hypothetical protein ABJZ55_07710 [Fuerstiella sp.]
MNSSLLHWPVSLLLCFAGCAKETPVPRFAGTIVSHVDSYGSGTGTSHQLSPAGQMRSGFDETDDVEADWIADVKWSFLRREDGADVYRVEWQFVERNRSSVPRDAELAFDGVSPSKLAVSDQLIISIEPDLSSVDA